MRAVSNRVVDDDAGPAPGIARGDVELPGLDVPAHAGVAGVRIRAVPGRHPACRHLARHIEEDREIPGLHQLVPVEEQAVDDENGPGRRDGVRGFEDHVATEAMRSGTVHPGPTRTQWFQYVGNQPPAVERVQPESLGRGSAAAVPDRPEVMEVVDRDPHHGPPGAFEHRPQLVGEDGLSRGIGTVDADPDAVLAGRDGHERSDPAQQLRTSGADAGLGVGVTGRHPAILASPGNDGPSSRRAAGCPAIRLLSVATVWSTRRSSRVDQGEGNARSVHVQPEGDCHRF